MATPDIINATFELGGALVLCLNIRRLLVDHRLLRGVSWVPTLFFAAFGMWNIYFYRHIDQPVSWWAGVLVLVVNLVWLACLLRLTVRDVLERHYG